MIIFVTGQYAGAQYIYPLIKKWQSESGNHPEYKIVATGTSVNFWQQCHVGYVNIEDENSDSVEHYLDIVKPRLIVLSASGSEELEHLFILSAKCKGIRTASFIDTWTNYKNRFIYNNKDLYPDTIFSIDDKCTAEMIEDGIPSELIQEIGQPYLEDICQNIPPLGSKILLPMQPIKKTRNNSLGYDENDFLQLSLEAVNMSGNSEQIQITSHPSDILNISNQESIKVSTGRGIKDVKNAHTVIGLFSMQMIIGYLWGRKVASVQPGLKVTDPSPLSRWGAVPIIKDSDDLIKFIKTPSNDLIMKNDVKLVKRYLPGSVNRLQQYIRKEIG